MAGTGERAGRVQQRRHTVDAQHELADAVVGAGSRRGGGRPVRGRPMRVDVGAADHFGIFFSAAPELAKL